MKNNKIFYIVGILLLLLITYFVFFYEEEDLPFNKIEFTEGNRILNREMPKYMDTIVLAGLSELNIKNSIILLKPLKIKEIGEDLELMAYIVEIGGTYVINIKDLSRSKSILVIAHELIHLKQYFEDRILITKDELIWDHTKHYDIKNLPEYGNRPWEIEAFDKELNLRDRIKTTLYK